MTPSSKHAPVNLSYVAGDPSELRKVEAEELSVGGDSGLADALHNVFRKSKGSVLGIPVEKQFGEFWQRKPASVL